MSELRVLDAVIQTRDLTVRSGDLEILRGVSIEVPRRMVTGVIGPSGAGKSTLLKCLNRLIDLSPSMKVSGDVLIDGASTRHRDVDVDDLRRRIGMVFQQPVMFPGSIADNVVFGAKRLGLLTRNNRDEVLESTLRSAGLWSEVRDRLKRPATTLSVGQQQRLAIARTLAGEPDVLLMDEPTSALDRRSTEQVEETIRALVSARTVVMVTHHLEQARRVCDYLVCICAPNGYGEVMEAASCESLFCCPAREETAEFLRAVR